MILSPTFLQSTATGTQPTATDMQPVYRNMLDSMGPGALSATNFMNSHYGPQSQMPPMNPQMPQAMQTQQAFAQQGQMPQYHQQMDAWHSQRPDFNQGMDRDAWRQQMDAWHNQRPGMPGMPGQPDHPAPVGYANPMMYQQGGFVTPGPVSYHDQMHELANKYHPAHGGFPVK